MSMKAAWCWSRKLLLSSGLLHLKLTKGHISHLFYLSHDMRLISQVAKEIWICDNKTVTRYKGNIENLPRWVLTRSRGS